jgi:autotransporter-associated beta strand protein
MVKFASTLNWLLAALTALSLTAHAQTLTLTSGVQKYGSLTNTRVSMSGKCELWVTNSSAPILGCTINLNSVDSWLFLPGIRPSLAGLAYMSQVRVNGSAAIANNNVRVVQYGQYGSVIIPQATTFQPLTVFSQPQFGGSSNLFNQWTYYTGSGLGSFSSFKLKRGYQAVFAQSTNGMNYSQCYVAQDGDLEVGALPATLDKQVQFIYVTPWRWVSKKGIAGNPGINLLNVNWWYDWNIDQNSSRDLEYVAIRQNQGWPPLNQNWQALGINTLLGYNEPDQANQADMSVSTAISSWGDLLATGLRVGAPAVSDGGPSGWLFPFMQQANAAGLRVDFVPIHYYQANNPANPSACASQMYNFLLNVYNNTHRPIWVTEWNNGANWTDNDPWPVPTYAQQQACIAAMVNMLETTPFVERYALYNWVEDPRSLVTSSNTVTAAGTTYSNTVSALSYTQAMPVNPTRGIAQFLFASNTEDTSGYCNDAMAVGAPAFATGHNSQAKSVVLDGANSYIQVPANISNASNFTFAGWVYWNGGASWQRIFDFGNDTSHYLFLTPSSGAGTLRFAINNGNGEQIVETSPLASGSWQHVAVTISGSVAFLYVNGRQVALTGGLTNLPSEFAPAKNYLGKSQFPADPMFNGQFDEVEIANYAMTPAQIAALYTNVPSSIPLYVSGVWTNDADGDWSVSNNWNNGVIANGGNGVSYSADFSTVDLTADRTVTLDSARSIGGLYFGDPSGSYNWTLTGDNSLTLSSGYPLMEVNQNAATISVPLAGNSGFAKSGAGTLVLTAAGSLTGNINVDSDSRSANDGIVRVANSDALGDADAIQIQNSGSGSSTLQLDGTISNVSLPQNISLNGRLGTVPAIESLAGTNALSGAIGVYGAGNYLLQADSGVLNINGTISPSDNNSDTITFQGSGTVSLNGAVGNGNGTMSVDKTGSGTLAFAPGSTYSGSTTVSKGTLALQSSPGPLLHLTFNNVAGSSNGSVITNTGTGGAAMNGLIVGSGAAIAFGGRYGNALSINDVGGNSATNIVLINNKVLNTDAAGTWTVSYWIKTTTSGAVIMYQGDGTWSSVGQTAYLLNANTGTSAGTHAGAVRWAGGFLTGTAALNDNNWHFIALVDNTGTESIYVDGNVDAVTSSLGLPLATGADQIWIGGAPDTDVGAVKMSGMIDEVYMFNRALSQAEVQSLYDNNSITNPSGNVLPATSALNIAAGGVLDLAGISQTIGSLSGSGVMTNMGGPASLTIDNTGDTTFAGGIDDASLSDALRVVQEGSGTTLLSGANTYHGTTTVNGGKLLVDGSIGSGAVTVSNGTLGGNGVIGGTVAVQSNGTLAPGGDLSTLTVSNNVSLEPGSTTVLEISHTAQTNDQLALTGILTYGGTLVVTNLSGTLAAGDRFQLFQAGSNSGSFSTMVLPVLNDGLGWSTANLVSGFINVVPTAPANLGWNVNGANINLSWPPGYLGWRLQVQTNALNAGLGTNWVTVPGSSLTNLMVLPAGEPPGCVFYRLVYP